MTPGGGDAVARVGTRTHGVHAWLRWLSGALAASALLIGGCATNTTTTRAAKPLTRPLVESNVDRLGDVSVLVVEDFAGVGVGWSSAAQRTADNPMAQIGQIASLATGSVLGIMGSAVTNGMIDSAPSSRAGRVASLVNMSVDASDLGQGLRTAVDEASGNLPEDAKVSLRRPRVMEIPAVRVRRDALYIDPIYTLSRDGASLRVVVDAALIAPGLEYADGQTTRRTRTGPIYSNRFAYFSEPVPFPVLNEETREHLRAATRRAFAAASGRKNATGRKAAHALAEVEDDVLSESEAAILIAREWSKDDGARLKAEIERAHAFVAAALMKDMAGEDAATEFDGITIAETEAGTRKVVRLADGPYQGGYISQPASNRPLPDFGNASRMAVANRQRQRQAISNRTGWQP